MLFLRERALIGSLRKKKKSKENQKNLPLKLPRKPAFAKGRQSPDITEKVMPGLFCLEGGRCALQAGKRVICDMYEV
jgi:hypothetical protein